MIHYKCTFAHAQEVSVDKLFPLFDIPVPFYCEATGVFQVFSVVALVVCLTIVLMWLHMNKTKLIEERGPEMGALIYNDSKTAALWSLFLALLICAMGWVGLVVGLLIWTWESRI